MRRFSSSSRPLCPPYFRTLPLPLPHPVLELPFPHPISSCASILSLTLLSPFFLSLWTCTGRGETLAVFPAKGDPWSPSTNPECRVQCEEGRVGVRLRA